MTTEKTTLEELQNKLIEKLYDHLAGRETYEDLDTKTNISNYLYYEDEIGHRMDFEKVPCTELFPTPMDLLWKETQDAIIEDTEKIKMFEEAIAENKYDEDYLKKNIETLLEEREYLINSNIEQQKKVYEETKDVSCSRNFITLPLFNMNTAPNLLLENFWVEFAFYDDIGVNNGKYDEYKKLRNWVERKEFIKNNIEVTHILLKSKNSWVIKHFVPNISYSDLIHTTLLVGLFGEFKVQQLPENLMLDVNEFIKEIEKY